MRLPPALLWLVLASLLSWTARAENSATLHVDVWLSDQDGPYRELVDQFAQRLKELIPKQPLIHSVVAGSEAWDQPVHVASELLVAVGIKATQRLLQSRGKQPILSLLVPRGGFQRTLQEHGATPAENLSAIYLDQPWDRQLRLIDLSVPGYEELGTLLGPASARQLPTLSRAAEDAGKRLHSAQVSEENGYLQPLRRLLERSEVLLAVPDPLVFNRQNLQGILLSTYHRQVPVFGFSAGYVRAGALAAVYSTPSQIADQAAEWLAKASEQSPPRLPAPSHPVYYSVAVNHRVARSLNIRVPEGVELAKQLQRDEQETR